MGTVHDPQGASYDTGPGCYQAWLNLNPVVDRGSQYKHRTAPVPIGAIDPTTHIRRSG